MPITNGQTTFTIGRDVTLRMVGPDGSHQDLSNAQNFDRKPEYDTIDVKLLNGVNVHSDLPRCWMGSFEVVRKDANIDKMFDNVDKKWHNNGRIDFGTLFAYITEADGSQTVEKYSNVSFKYEDAGQFAEKEVRQKIAFTAQTRDL